MRIRTFLLLLAVFISGYTFSQQARIVGSVKDASTGKPLGFCSIGISGTGRGTVSNEDGFFTLYAEQSRDTVMFIFLGYETKKVPVHTLIREREVLLKPKALQLNEIKIYPDDYMYFLVSECRKKLKKNKSYYTSKIYYAVNTHADNQPVELVECYYNGFIKGIRIENLKFKNGRLGLAQTNNHYFFTLHTSDAILRMDLLKTDKHYPSSPFSYDKKDLEKNFRFKWGDRNDEVCSIKFFPTKEKENFSGEAWIDMRNYELLRIDLSVDNSERHPFLPLFVTDSISDVSMKVSQNFRNIDGAIRPGHINFQYSFNYKSVRDTPMVASRSVVTRNINSEGIISAYDYDEKFMMPYFDYDDNYDDYRKMSLIPFNPDFWQNNQLLLSENQKRDLGFLADRGHLINYIESNYGGDFLKDVGYDSLFKQPGISFYEDYYCFWSESKRIIINRKAPPKPTTTALSSQLSFVSDSYHLEVQILLDLNRVGDSIRCRSFTVFDGERTFYYLPKDSLTDCIANICFDICEIERRHMQEELNENNYSPEQIDKLYKQTKDILNTRTTAFLNEVQSGKNIEALLKWNEYVKNNLGIDNIKMFRLIII